MILFLTVASIVYCKIATSFGHADIVNITFAVSTNQCFINIVHPNRSITNVNVTTTECSNIETILYDCKRIASNITNNNDMHLCINCKIMFVDEVFYLNQNNSVVIDNTMSNINRITFSSPSNSTTASSLIISNTITADYSFITIESFSGTIVFENLYFTQQQQANFVQHDNNYYIGQIFNIFESQLVIAKVQFESIPFLSIISSLNSNISISNSQFISIDTNGSSIAFNLLENSFLMLENVLFKNNQLLGGQDNNGNGNEIDGMIVVGNNSELFCLNCSILSSIFKSSTDHDSTSMITLMGNNSIITFDTSIISNNIGNLISIKRIDNSNYNYSIYLNSVLFAKNDNGSAIYAQGNNSLVVMVNNSQFLSNTATKGSVIKTDSNILMDISVETSIFDNNTARDGWGAVFSMLDAIATINIHNCEFSGNIAQDGNGGVFFVFDLYLNVDNSRFSRNQASSFGGVLNAYTGMITMENCIFDNNTASSGGIFATGSLNTSTSIAINNCTMHNNNAGDHGGVLRLFSGSVNATNSIFETNRAGSDGGVLSAGHYSNEDDDYSINISIFITNCTLYNNTAGDNGGVLNINSITNEFVLSGNRIRNNIANTAGGAVCVKLLSADTLEKNDTMDVLLNNNHFRNNSAWSSDGGGLYLYGENVYFIVDLDNCLFNNNDALYYGGAIMINHGSITMNKCIFDKNTAYDGGSIYIGDYYSHNFDDSKYLYINNSIFINNIADYDGGVVCIHSIISLMLLENSILNKNEARYGGTIGMRLPTNKSDNYMIHWTMINNTFYDNTGFLGGAVYSRHWSSHKSQTLYVVNCNFSNNNANGGAAIIVYQSTIIANNTYFVNNAVNWNGAVFWLGYGSSFDFKVALAADNCTFVGNSGGIALALSIMEYFVLSNSVIYNNNVQAGGVILDVNLNAYWNESFAGRTFTNDVVIPINISSNYIAHNTAHQRFAALYAFSILLDPASQTFVHTQL